MSDTIGEPFEATDADGGGGVSPKDLRKKEAFYRKWLSSLAYRALNVDREIGGPPLVTGWLPFERLLNREPLVNETFPRATQAQRMALLAGLYQIQDLWDASHEAAQKAEELGETKVSAYWHGIAHRREPDAGNASYWFRRIGRHPVFPKLVKEARPLVENAAIAARLMPRGEWDPFAFIEFCGESPRGDDRLARTLQRLEMQLLFKASLPA